MKRWWIAAGLALSVIAYEINVAVLRRRLAPVVEPEPARDRRDPLEGLVPSMRMGMPRPIKQ
jgi:hypothetical protein